MIHVTRQQTEHGHAVEYLVFDVNPELIDRFIEMDHQYWTLFLKDQAGFSSKHVWINKVRPGEVSLIIYWNTVEEWKSISEEKLVETERRFAAAFGEENYRLVREVHKGNALVKVREYSV